MRRRGLTSAGWGMWTREGRVSGRAVVVSVGPRMGVCAAAKLLMTSPAAATIMTAVVRKPRRLKRKGRISGWVMMISLWWHAAAAGDEPAGPLGPVVRASDRSVATVEGASYRPIG